MIKGNKALNHAISWITGDLSMITGDLSKVAGASSKFT